jgi:hypothetical protein
MLYSSSRSTRACNLVAPLSDGHDAVVRFLVRSSILLKASEIVEWIVSREFQNSDK